MTRLAGWGFFLAGLGIFLHYAFAIGFDLVDLSNYMEWKWTSGVKRGAP